MKGVFVLLLATLAVANAWRYHRCACTKTLSRAETPSLIKSNLRSEPVSNLPESFDWRFMNGSINMVTMNMNQHNPVYCGSCWSFAVTSSLSDRIRIMRNARFPEINLAPQVLITCNMENNGCNGGNPSLAHKYIAEHGITDWTCAPYQAKGHDGGLTCDDMAICKNCDHDGKCWAQKDYHTYTIEEYGTVFGEQDMMNELVKRGPMACDIAVTQELDDFTGGSIFEDKTGRKEDDHVVSLVGYGVENGQKYWVIRNSWGSYWADNGFGRIVRGKDNLGIESLGCHWAVPKNTWGEGAHGFALSVAEKKGQANSGVLPTKEFSGFAKYNFIKPGNDIEPSEYVLTPRPHEYINTQSLPKSWDWRDVNGVNYVSWTRNQHIPVYCGSCWAHATLSAISDRFNIMNKNQWPEVGLAPQVVLNCAAGGSCHGGQPGSVYSFMKKHGVPDETCNNYLARDPESADCSAMQVCMDCPAHLAYQSFLSEVNGKCIPVNKFKLYKVSEYGYVEGADKMKAEIFARGPISCGVSVTDAFEKYTGGIYSEKSFWPRINHEISVVGWGEENGVEYFIGRNSWGSYWGENGYFRIKMHEDNLGIESDCYWAVPKLDNEEIPRVVIM